VLDRDATDAVLDEINERAVEAALQLKEGNDGCEVTVLTMGPDRATDAIRKALSMGADKAVHLSDDALAGSDAVSTAKVLAKAIERAGEIELVLTATESTDGYTGTIPAQVAELLGWPSLTFAKHVEVGDGKVSIQRQTEAGYDEVESTLPAVVSVTAGVVEPRYPSFKGIMEAKKKPVQTLSLADLSVDAAEVGFSGASTTVVEHSKRPARQAGTRVTDSGEGGMALVEFLASEKFV